MSWTGPSRLIAADIAADELSDLVAGAVHRPDIEVARLRLYLASLRIDPAATAPVTSLLEARTRGAAENVRIQANADLVTARRIGNIRTVNVAVGLVTLVVAIFGNQAWNASHPPPSFPPNPRTQQAARCALRLRGAC